MPGFCVYPKAKAVRDALIHEANGLLFTDKYSNYTATGSLPPNTVTSGTVHFNVREDEIVDVRIAGLDKIEALHLAHFLGELFSKKEE